LGDSDGKGCESTTSAETVSLHGIESIQNLLEDASLLVPPLPESPAVAFAAIAESQSSEQEAAAIQRRPHLRAHAVLPCRQRVAHPQQPTSADVRARAGDTAALSHAAVLALCMQCLD
jgi:hypothetical protein